MKLFEKDDSCFCKPYESKAQARLVKIAMDFVLLPATMAMFSHRVSSLWSKYLHSKDKKFLVFDSKSYIAEAFARSEDLKYTINHFMRQIERNNTDDLEKVPPNKWTEIPVNELIPPEDVTELLNFGNPYDIPGHIAGGVSGSDFGVDSRQLVGAISVLREVDSNNKTRKYTLKSKLYVVVRDAIDFCPGGAGSGLESHLTIPLSRLEASGLAHDVGFLVIFEIPYTTYSFEPYKLVTQRYFDRLDEIKDEIIDNDLDDDAAEKLYDEAATIIEEKKASDSWYDEFNKPHRSDRTEFGENAEDKIVEMEERDVEEVVDHAVDHAVQDFVDYEPVNVGLDLIWEDD